MDETGGANRNGGAGRRRAGAGHRLALRNWRLPTRLAVLILVPTLTAVALGGTRVTASLVGLAAHERALVAAEYAGWLRDLARHLALERDKTLWSDISHGPAADRAEQAAAIGDLVRKVRDGLRRFDDSYGTKVVDNARQLERRLAEFAPAAPAGRPVDHDGLIAVLLRLHEELGRLAPDAETLARARALHALACAQAEASRQRGQLTTLLLAGRRLAPDELESFISARSRQRAHLEFFNAEGGTAAAQLLAETVTGTEVHRAELAKARAIALAGRNLPVEAVGDRSAAARQWFSDSTRTIELMGAVEHRLAAAMLDRSRQQRDAEERAAWTTGGLVAALLLVVLGATAVIARSMVLPLRRLRAEALDIADRRLPQAVRRMRAEVSGGEVREPAVRPVGVDGRDEIGEVARAFDAVHRQAVRLAAEEARLRGTVNGMFVNLSRRTQSLAERQIHLIDGLERGEQDGTRLADLFKLDHLATRMRRNSENLLVLAGHEPARRRSRPAVLMDVVRAALSEVEGYDRVRLQLRRDVAIVGHAVTDAVHLLAELVENAIAFSPEDSRVIVSGGPADDGGVLVTVVDRGLGMGEAELAEANRRLAEPPPVDVSVARRMGLFVVGRLALRHGIRVRLRAGEPVGLVATVRFPPELVVAAEPVREPAAPPVRRRHAGKEAVPRPVPAALPAPVAETDPLPAVGESPLDGMEEYLPIFAAVESAWFRRSGTGVPGAGGSRPAPEAESRAPAAVAQAEDPWSSPADGGWRAAEAVRAPTMGGITAAGLPRRTPRANLVPGSAGRETGIEPPEPVSADRVRDRLSGFQHGVRRARAEVARGAVDRSVTEEEEP